MLPDQLVNGLIAVVVGIVAAVPLLLPTAAVRYRSHGRLTWGDLITTAAAAIYGAALFTFTMLPLPAGDDVRCRGVQLELFGSIGTVIDRGLPSLSRLPHDGVFLAFVGNIAFFVPLGFFVRLLARRGVILTTVAGFVISLMIELTQLTGLWGLRQCAYRVFDVDDLVVNTAGALLGGVLALLVLVPLGLPRPVPAAGELPTEITLGRRCVGFLSDALVMTALAALGTLLWWIGPRSRGLPFVAPASTAELLVRLSVLLVPQAVMVLGTGRTVGEWVVAVRPVANESTSAGRPPTGRLLGRRLVMFGLGVGGASLLLVGAFPGSHLLLALLVAVSAGLTRRTAGHRSLAQLAGGLELSVDAGSADPGPRPTGSRTAPGAAGR